MARLIMTFAGPAPRLEIGDDATMVVRAAGGREEAELARKRAIRNLAEIAGARIS